MSRICLRILIHVPIAFLCFSATAQFSYQTLFVQYDSVWTFRKLSIIPVKFRGDGWKMYRDNLPKNAISLQEAVRSGKLSIKEMKVDKGSDVSVLVVKNKTGKNVLVNSGEILVGGKQDRVTAEASFITPQKEEQYLSVFCAEKGRWDDKEKPFHYHSVVDIGVKKKIDVEHRQPEVWKEIGARFTGNKSASETFAYQHVLQQMQQEDSAYLNFFLQKFRLSDSTYAGFIAVTGNRIIACELFSMAEYLTLHYEQMITAFVHSITVNDRVPQLPYNTIAAFADALLGDEATQKKLVQTNGKADKFQGKIFHLIAYGN